MQVTTIEGIVKNGRIQLSEDIKLPENAIVYVVIPSLKISTKKIMSPHQIDKETAKDFEKIVEEDL